MCMARARRVLLQGVDASLASFLTRMPGGGEIQGMGSNLAVVLNSSQFVMRIVARVQNATARVMNHPGVKVMIKLYNQTQTLVEKARALIEGP